MDDTRYDREIIEKKTVPPQRGARVMAYLEAQLSRKPEKQELTLAQRAKRGLLWFFAVMLALAFLSRAANEALLAQVTVSRVSGGVIDQSVSGTGTWVAADEKQQRTEYSGLRISEIFVRAGETIAQGAPLYCYETASIQTALGELSRTIEKYKLQIKQLKTGRSDSAQSAALSLSQAQRALSSAQDKLDLGASDVAAQKRRTYEAALLAYQTQEAQRDSQILAAQQAVTDAEALDPSDPAAQTAVEEARAALTALNVQWDASLSGSLSTLEEAKREWDSVRSGEYDYTSELSPYREAVENAAKALETAQFNYVQAQENDGNANANIKYQIDGLELDMAVEEEKHDALEALLAAKGVVCANANGTVTAVNAAEGSLSTGEAVITFSTEGLMLSAQVNAEEASGLNIGDAVTLIRDGKPVQEKLSVSAIDLPGADGLCRIYCTDESGAAARPLGGAQEFLIEKNTEKQNTRVPIAALREDGNGTYYVLVLGTKDTVLGTQQIAVRVNVTLLSHDENHAAVEGGLSGNDELITGSNKPVSEGDRVELQDA